MKTSSFTAHFGKFFWPFHLINYYGMDQIFSLTFIYLMLPKLFFETTRIIPLFFCYLLGCSFSILKYV